MDIQRGDQVYYRGEVWTVWKKRTDSYGLTNVYLERENSQHIRHYACTTPSSLQRVERVR